MKLKRNMGSVDRAIRMLIGVSLLYLGPISNMLTSDYLSGVLLAIVGVIAISSAASGYCLLYQIAGFCTYSPRDSADQPSRADGT